MTEYTYLAHHGVKGQRHGVRQWQNPDGSLTPAGRVHYGVGAAREKVKSAASSVGKIIKSSVKNLASDRREARRVSKLQKAQIKKQSQEYKESRAAIDKANKEQHDEQIKEYVARMSSKSFAEVMSDARQADIDAMAKRVDRLAKKQEQIRTKEMLKAQEKQLKKSMKDVKKQAKKDAAKRFSRNDIKNLTDQEIDDRISRLKKEATLRELEFERATPTVASKLGNAVLDAGTRAVSEVTKNALTSIGNKWFKQFEPAVEKTEIEKLRDAISDMKTRREYDDLVSGRKYSKEADADKVTALRNRNERAKLEKEYDDLVSGRKYDQEADRDEVTALRNRNDRVKLEKEYEGLKSGVEKKSAEDRTKEYALKVTKRKELERRAQNFYGTGDKAGKMSIEEIAKRMNLTVNQVKDLLYV